MTGKEASKTDRLLQAYRDWQEALVTAACSTYCSDLEDCVYRLVGANSPFENIDWEQLHREAFPEPANRPPRLVPDGMIEDLKLSDVLFDTGHGL